MRYNGSDTIYFKSAEKMLAIGLKLMSNVFIFLFTINLVLFMYKIFYEFQ